MKFAILAILAMLAADMATPVFAQNGRTCTSQCSGPPNNRTCTRTCY